MKLQQVAQKLGCRLEGDGSVEITGVAGIDHATPGHVTFLANRRYSPMLKTTCASAVLLEDGVAVERGANHNPLAALRTPIPTWPSRRRLKCSTRRRATRPKFIAQL